jgi:hypothetical protein
MRRLGIRSVCLAALVTLLAGLGSASAAAANKKLVEGTVYDATCATSCAPECPPPPHCGPITAGSTAAIICPLRERRIIACPLNGSTAQEVSPPICLPQSGCVSYPVYSGEGATVKVRKRGSSSVLATLPVVEGHFKIRLGAGEYVLHPYLPEEPCWSGTPETVKVTARTQGPIPASLDVSDSCVVHPDATP